MSSCSSSGVFSGNTTSTSNVTSLSSSPNSISTLLEYEEELYREMFSNPACLLIMAEGLGVERIFLNFLKLYSDSSHLVLVLNTHEAEEDYFIERLKYETAAGSSLSIYGNSLDSKSSSQPLDSSAISIQLPTRITTETHTVAERVETYLKGGCFFVTSRILVVDMLTDRVPIDLVSGILVYNAHKIIDSCQETFILRMFRQKNKVKKFSVCLFYFILFIILSSLEKKERFHKSVLGQSGLFHAWFQQGRESHAQFVLHEIVHLSAIPRRRRRRAESASSRGDRASHRREREHVAHTNVSARNHKRLAKRIQGLLLLCKSSPKNTHKLSFNYKYLIKKRLCERLIMIF